MEKLDRIIRTIDLANTLKRNEALSSLIIEVLYEIEEPIGIDNIVGLVQTQFDFTPFKNEIADYLASPEATEKGIKSTNNSLFSLGEEKRIEIFVKNSEIDNNHKTRIERWALLIREIDNQLSAENYKLLANIYNEFIQLCFMRYDTMIRSYFLPDKIYLNDNSGNQELVFNGEPYKECEKKLNDSSLIAVFNKMLSQMPNKMDGDDVNYLFLLAQKTEHFFFHSVFQRMQKKN